MSKLITYCAECAHIPYVLKLDGYMLSLTCNCKTVATMHLTSEQKEQLISDQPLIVMLRDNIGLSLYVSYWGTH